MLPAHIVKDVFVHVGCPENQHRRNDCIHFYTKLSLKSEEPNTWSESSTTTQLIILCVMKLLFFLHLPVESVAHLDGDQHRQGHGHGRAGLKDLAFNAGEVLVFVMALHEVGLHGGDGRLISMWLNFHWYRGAMGGG